MKAIEPAPRRDDGDQLWLLKIRTRDRQFKQRRSVSFLQPNDLQRLGGRQSSQLWIGTIVARQHRRDPSLHIFLVDNVRTEFQIADPASAHTKPVVWSLAGGQIEVQSAAIVFNDRVKIAIGRSLKQNGMGFLSFQQSEIRWATS